MPRKSNNYETKKLNLIEGDWDKLVEMYGNDPTPTAVIRQLVHRHVRENYRPTQLPDDDIPVPL